MTRIWSLSGVLPANPLIGTVPDKISALWRLELDNHIAGFRVANDYRDRGQVNLLGLFPALAGSRIRALHQHWQVRYYSHGSGGSEPVLTNHGFRSELG